MKKILEFILGRVNSTSLQFHYLRVGAAKPILDRLREQYPENELEWVQHEVDNFRDYHFGASYGLFNGSVINMEVNDEELSNLRRDFWENFVWQTEDKGIPVAIIIPSSQEYGSMTIAEISEALSLIRLHDRPIKLFEYSETVDNEVATWLLEISSFVHRNEVTEEQY